MARLKKATYKPKSRSRSNFKARTRLQRSKASKRNDLRFKVLVAEFSKARNGLEKEVRQRTGELKIKSEQLEQQVQKQKLSEEQTYIFKQAIESTAEGIFLIDAEQPALPIIYANQSFLAMTGYRSDDILGKNFLVLYEFDANRRVLDEIKESMREGMFFYGEMASVRKSGEKIWVLLRIVPVRDITGAITHFMGLQTDITLMKREESQIMEQREELLHVTRVGKLAEFVSSLAHEISQPLAAILSYAQAAQRMLAGRESQIQEILGYIVNDDQRAAEVIRRLRSLLKKGKSEMKLLDINDVVNETVTLLMTDAVVRNNVMKTELGQDIPLVRGDRVQLQQVLLNLISNSFDALEGADEDSREILISTSRKDADTVMVEVKDSGCGIPAKNMEKLFEHFFTSKADGLGMGLSISRSIVEAHGGHLDVENNPGRGVTFYFTIPVRAKDAL